MTLKGIYEETGLKFVIDSVFCTVRFPFLIKSLQDYLTADSTLLTHNEHIQDLVIKRETISIHQSAEWGMHGVCLVFNALVERYSLVQRTL